MKPIFTALIFSFSLLSPPAQNRCGSVEHRHQLQLNDPNWQNRKAIQESAISEWINTNRNGVEQRSIMTIPVVVHVLWNSPEENIPDEQIISQIDVLNQDYQALNAEIPSIPAVFQPLIADIELEFCLAAVDPDGNQTTGITRKFTNNPVGIGGITAIHYSVLGGQDAWDTERYLNIWVAKFAGGIGGISSFPGIGPPEEDGVEVNYLQFGNINVDPPYHLGRTLTHEIGHYFNLEHPWGPSITDCCEDDFVADTPESCETYIGQCPTHPAVSCSIPDIFMDFMFYSDDDCMGMFTNGQKMRMLATLNTLRQGLLENDVCEYVPTTEADINGFIKILNNPIQEELLFEISNLNFNNGHILLHSLKGIVVLNKEINNAGVHSIDVAEISAGIYFFVFENNQMRAVKKVVVK